VDFFVAFAVHTSEQHVQDEELISEILHHLLLRAGAKSRYVRARATQMIGGVMLGLSEDAEIRYSKHDSQPKIWGLHNYYPPADIFVHGKYLSSIQISIHTII
jgi:hypothetical protein